MSRAAWQALVLTAIAAALAAAVTLTERRPVARARGPLVPGLEARDLVGIALERDGAPPIELALGALGARVTSPAPGTADAVAVRDLVSALVAARADRWLRGAAAWKRAGLDHPALTVRLTTHDGTATLVLGDRVDAAGQRWIGRPPDAVALVPAWVGTALDRELPALRARRVFPAAAPSGVELHGPGRDLVLAGTALVRRDDGTSGRLAPSVRAGLVAALGALVLVDFAPAPSGEPLGTVRVLGGDAPAELTWFGPCAGRADAVAVDATIGAGCVERARLDDLLAAAAAAATGVSPQPLDGTAALAGIAIADGGRTVELVRHGAAWTIAAAGSERTADAGAAAAIEAALAAPATVRPLAPADDVRRAERWQVATADGETQAWQVWRGPDRVTIRRGDERFALDLAPDAAAAVRTVGPGLRDRALVALDPGRVAAIVATGVAPARLARGELIGEWLVEAPRGAGLADGADALPAVVAQLRVERWSDAAALGPVRRTLIFTGDPPPGAGAATVDTLRIGAPIAGGGCWVAVDDGAAGALPAAACARLLAPLTR